jgi:hypothetical protein
VRSERLPVKKIREIDTGCKWPLFSGHVTYIMISSTLDSCR